MHTCAFVCVDAPSRLLPFASPALVLTACCSKQAIDKQLRLRFSGDCSATGSVSSLWREPTQSTCSTCTAKEQSLEISDRLHGCCPTHQLTSTVTLWSLRQALAEG